MFHSKELIKETLGIEDGKEIFVFCQRGNKSRFVTNKLREFGFKAFNVIGGLTKYKEIYKNDILLV